MSKYKVKAKEEYKLTGGVLYPVYLDGTNHISIQDGNMKLGKGISNYSVLPGDEPLRLKNGIQLTNLCGTCHGCCKECKKECYGILNGVRHHNSCIPAWANNTVLAKEDPEVFWYEMQKHIDNNIVPIMRIHMAGEYFSKEYMKQSIEFASKNKMTTFYPYNKRYTWLEELDDEIGLPSNFHPLVSIWHNNYANPKGFAEFIYDDGTQPELDDLPHCPAVDKYGRETGWTCARCKHCPFAERGSKMCVYAHGKTNWMKGRAKLLAEIRTK